MPNIIVYRRLANVTAGQQFGVGTRNDPSSLVMYPNSYRTKAEVQADEAPEFLRVLKGMEAAGTIGWQFDSHDLDPDDVRVVAGMDVADGDSSNTTSNYYANVSPGRVRMGSHSFAYNGGNDLDPLALGIDVAGASKASGLLADGNAIKCRWFAVRQYNVGTDDESLVLVPVFGTEAATATVGAVTADTYFPTDAEVEAAFKAATARLIASRIYVSWIEIGRQLFSRSTTTISTSFVDVKDSDPEANEGIQIMRVEIDHADFPNATAYAVALGDLPHAIFVGAGLRVLEASDLADITVELGKTGQTNELFDQVDVGTSASAAVGPKATPPRGSSPVAPGTTLVDYKPLITFGSSGALDGATSGKVLVTLAYLPLPEVGNAGVRALQRDENEL